MMKFPARIPVGGSVTVTQKFGSLQNAGWYVSNGLPPSHNGQDTVFGTPQQTYGTPFVCPLDYAYTSKIEFTTPLSTKGNGITIGGKYNGKDVLIVFWHCSEVVNKASFTLGETVGYAGNSGLVNPEPSSNTPFHVWDGAHLHLMVYEWDGTNWALKDPSLYFDVSDPFRGDDTGVEKDLPAVVGFIERLKIAIQAFINSKNA